MKSILWRALLSFGLVASIVAVGPGAGRALAAEALVNHGFGFHALWESPNVEILDFRYGRSKLNSTWVNPAQTSKGLTPQQAGIWGEFPVGEDLYVKWRIRTTGEEFEDTVQLKGLLPHDMRHHQIRFIADDSRLYVSVITPYRLEINLCLPRPDVSKMRQSEDPFDRVLGRNCYTRFSQIYPGPERSWS